VRAFGQTAPGPESHLESPDYNGLDYTRPQQNAELRLQYRTSSAPTTQTDQERTYLKLATKIELPAGRVPRSQRLRPRLRRLEAPSIFHDSWLLPPKARQCWTSVRWRRDSGPMG
jgi:hypothetical protein